MKNRGFTAFLLVISLLLSLGIFALGDSSSTPELSSSTAYVPPTKPPATPEPTSDLSFAEFPDVDYAGAEEEPAQESTDDVFNILLLGSDQRIEGTKDTGRSDCIMLASVNFTTGDIKLISFERAIIVPIPASLTPDGSTSDLLTHAYRWGGAELMKSVLKDCFGVEADAYVHVDFDTFVFIFDAIGGIDVELTAQEAFGMDCGYALGTGAEVHNYVAEGWNHLDGHDTLVYCRLRVTDDDWARQQRQRNVLCQVLKKASGLSLTELNTLANKVLYFSDTDLSFLQIAKLMLHSSQLLNCEVEELQVPGKNEASDKINCDFAQETLRISEFIYG